MSRLSEADEAHLLCRTLGHAWKPTMVKTTKGPRGRIIEYRPHLVCDRCDTLKVMIMAANGDLGGSRYVYPEGYLQRGDDARWGRTEVRTEFVRRWFAGKESQ